MFYRSKSATATAMIIGLSATLPAHAENRIDTQLPSAPELAAYGSLPVGARQIDLSDPGRIEILAIDPAAAKPDPLPTYDRPVAVEVWYPAAAGASGSTTLQTVARDGTTAVALEGRAVRDAEPDASGTVYPLVLVSHGYPGNRFLMSHLAENIASKGYVVASIDHTDSTYSDKAAFGSTLVNRSLDQLFVLNEMARLSAEDGFLNGLLDADNTGLIGYSMGGYGAVITAGGGVTEASVGYAWGAPHGTLAQHQAGSETHKNLPDARIKTAVAFGPWGMNTGFWDAEGLAGVQIPMLFIAGSQDDVSLYEKGVRAIWENTTGVDRALLTYVNGGHNSGAPMPAPQESFRDDDALGFNVSEHYTDPVWDTARMNNIAQHFVTAWLDLELKGDGEKAGYLDLTEDSNAGIWSVAEDGSEKPDHNYWKGFAKGTAKGLLYERRAAGE